MTADGRVPALLADLGATNARFALVGAEGIHDIRILQVNNHPTLASAIGTYLDQVDPPRPPRQAAIAVAGPITGDLVSMTNHAWAFRTTELRAQLALDRLEILNDFTAVALSVPWLAEPDRVQLGPGAPVPGQPIGVLGAGTGLGVSGIIPTPDGWTALAGEGGHVTMPAATDREAELLRRLRRRFQHVSAERLLSGMGLTNLYETLAALDGADVPAREPAEVTAAAASGVDRHAVEAVDMFCGMLGTVAGNLALTIGARGGVFVAGGIAPKLGERFLRSTFRERFEAKGRMRSYLQPIPTYVVIHPTPAFLGLRAVLERPGR